MNITNLLVSIGFLLLAYLFYYLKNNHPPDYLKPQKDDDYSDKGARFLKNFKRWFVIFVCIFGAMLYLIKAF